MSRVLVAYASKHGATAEIAEAIADQLREAGHATDCMPTDQVKELERYDAAVVGSAVYMKRWRRDAHRLLKHERRALADRPLLSSARVHAARTRIRAGPSRRTS